MKRIGLYAIFLLIAVVTFALNVSGIFADAENVSCMVNGTCTENCTCPNDATCAQNCSSWQNASGNESCPVAGSSAQGDCGTAGKGCPVNLQSKSCGVA